MSDAKTAREKVLERWPDARSVYYDRIPGWCVFTGKTPQTSWKLSDSAKQTEEEAWEEAALDESVVVEVPPPSPQPQEATFEARIQKAADEVKAWPGWKKGYAPAAPLDALSDATPQDDTVEKFVSDMPKLVEEAWRHEEKIAAGALRYPRTDYACQHLGKLIIDWIRHREERKPR